MRAPGQVSSPPGLLSTLPGSALSVLQGSGHTDTQLHEGTGWGARGVGMDVDKAAWKGCTAGTTAATWSRSLLCAGPGPAVTSLLSAAGSVGHQHTERIHFTPDHRG